MHTPAEAFAPVWVMLLLVAAGLGAFFIFALTGVKRRPGVVVIVLGVFAGLGFIFLARTSVHQAPLRPQQMVEAPRPPQVAPSGSSSGKSSSNKSSSKSKRSTRPPEPSGPGPNAKPAAPAPPAEAPVPLSVPLENDPVTAAKPQRPDWVIQRDRILPDGTRTLVVSSGNPQEQIEAAQMFLREQQFYRVRDMIVTQTRPPQLGGNVLYWQVQDLRPALNIYIQQAISEVYQETDSRGRVKLYSKLDFPPHMLQEIESLVTRAVGESRMGFAMASLAMLTALLAIAYGYTRINALTGWQYVWRLRFGAVAVSFASFVAYCITCEMFRASPF